MTAADHQFEKDRLAFEKEKFEREYALKEKEFFLREKELAVSKRKRTPTLVAIIVAVIGIVGTLVGYLIQGTSDQRLEKLKFESDLIAKVVSSNDLAQNKKNLKFLLDAGFITDKENKIKLLVDDTSFDLKIQQNNSPSQPYSFVSGIVQTEDGHPLSDVIVKVNDSVLVASTNHKGEFFFGVPVNDADVRVALIRQGYVQCNTIVHPENVAFLLAALKATGHRHSAPTTRQPRTGQGQLQ